MKVPRALRLAICYQENTPAGASLPDFILRTSHLVPRTSAYSHFSSRGRGVFQNVADISNDLQNLWDSRVILHMAGRIFLYNDAVSVILEFA